MGVQLLLQSGDLLDHFLAGHSGLQLLAQELFKGVDLLVQLLLHQVQGMLVQGLHLVNTHLSAHRLPKVLQLPNLLPCLFNLLFNNTQVLLHQLDLGPIVFDHLEQTGDGVEQLTLVGRQRAGGGHDGFKGGLGLRDHLLEVEGELGLLLLEGLDMLELLVFGVGDV